MQEAFNWRLATTNSCVAKTPLTQELELILTKAKNTFFVSTIAMMILATSGLNAVNAAPAKASRAVAHSSDVGGKYLPDAVVIAENLHPTANLSYKVAGKRYYPTTKVADNYTQTGRASWYGPGFHGKKTSSGERFDMNMMTAAHPTLPIPSYVRVTNLANGKSVVVRINDRGPFHGNRIIDLSKAAANKLGFLSKGTAQVRIELLKAGDRISEPKSLEAKAGKNIYLDLKTFASEKEAQGFLKNTSHYLEKAKLSQRVIMVKQKQGYVVRVGPFIEQKHADEWQQNHQIEVI
jgi:rare lipoprotein A